MTFSHSGNCRSVDSVSPAAYEHYYQTAYQCELPYYFTARSWTRVAIQIAYHFIGECAEMGIAVLGPDVNESGENFSPVENEVKGSSSIRFGLSAVKGVGMWQER